MPQVTWAAPGGDGGGGPAPAATPEHDGVIALPIGLADALATAALSLSNPAGRVLLSQSISCRAEVEALLLTAGRDVTVVDPRDIDAIGAAVDELTQVLLMDSITDSAELVELTDLSEMCHSHDLLLVVDHSRLSAHVLAPDLLGAALGVWTVADERTEVAGNTFEMSLLVRRLVLLGVAHHAVDAGEAPPPAVAVEPDDLGAVAGVARAEPLDWSECSWASECADRLDELVVVSTDDPTVDGRRYVTADSAVAVLRPGLLLVHRRWPAASLSAPDDLARTLAGPAPAAGHRPRRADAPLRRTRDSDRGAAEQLARHLAGAPWASQWTSRLAAHCDGERIVVELMPSLFCATRIVRPFRLVVDGADPEAGARLLAQAAAAAVLAAGPSAGSVGARVASGRLTVDRVDDVVDTLVSATARAGLVVRATVVGAGPRCTVALERSGAPVGEVEATLTRIDDAADGWGAIALPGTDLLVEPPWQAGGLDRGPDPGELLLAGVLADLAVGASAALEAPGWTLYLEARRELVGRAGPAPLRDAAVYLQLPDDGPAPAEVAEAVGTAWSSSPTLAVLNSDIVG